MSVIEKAELGGASGQQRFPFFFFSLIWNMIVALL